MVVGAGVLVLLIAVVLALPRLVDLNQYQPRVQAELEQRLGRSVSLGPLHLSLWPLGVRVENAVVGEDPRFGTERPFAQADELYVSPRLMPLLRGQFELRAVELRRPVIELIRDAEGTWNMSTLGAAEAEPAPTSDADAPTLVLHSLTISNGQVAVTDLQARQRRAVYDNIDVQLDGFAPDRAFDLMVAATLPGAGTERLSVRGTAGPIVRDEVAMTPFEGTARFEAVSLAGLQRFLEVEALDGTDAVISGTADLGNREGRMASKGSLQLAQARVRGVDIGYPIAVDYDLAYDFGTEVLTLTAGTVRLDRTPLSVTGTVNLRPETPVLDLHVTAADTSLAEAARLAAAFGVAFGTGTEVQGQLHADIRARGPADRPALEGDVRLRDIVISGADIPQPVRTQAVSLTLTPVEIRSDEFTATTGQTSLNVRFAVSRYTTDTPNVDAGIRATDADLGELLHVARAWGVDAVEGMSGSGRLSIDVRATGPTDDLTYSGSGSLQDGTLRGPALTEPLGVRTASLSFSQDAAMLENLAASLGGTSAQGRLTLRNFTAPQVEFELTADRIDVAEWQELFASPAESPAAEPQTPDEDSVLLRTTGSGTIRVGAIAYDQLVLNDVQAGLTLDRGLLRLDPVTAELFGGRHRGSIVVDARRTPASITVASDLEQVDANRLASAATNLRDAIHGALASKVRASFSADGAEQIAQTLNGTMSLDLLDGRIANMDLTREAGNIARFVTGQPPAERSTAVARLSGTMQVTNGVARTDDLTGAIEGGMMSAAGTINLVDQSLDLRLTTVFSREFSERVGGTQVGGLLTTALANQQGELVVPLLVTGTMQQPRFAPDVRRVAEMRVQNLVPNLRNPGELTTSILDAVTGPRDGETRTPGRTLEGVVDAIRGRGQAPPPPQAPQQPPASSPEPAPATPEPEAKDPAGQVQDILRGILGGRRQPDPAPAPAEGETPKPEEPPPSQ